MDLSSSGCDSVAGSGVTTAQTEETAETAQTAKTTQTAKTARHTGAVDRRLVPPQPTRSLAWLAHSPFARVGWRDLRSRCFPLTPFAGTRPDGRAVTRHRRVTVVSGARERVSETNEGEARSDCVASVCEASRRARVPCGLRLCGYLG
jgi:hypothetical protein